METQAQINYNRIAEAIEYIKNNFTQQPNLDEVAEQVHLSPFHFQRLFSEWAGTTPKKFLQYISIEHAKKLLADKHTTLLIRLLKQDFQAQVVCTIFSSTSKE
jgi:AraC family transcriptional regulator of adaptative response/methylated-DNA-[protein]-cysteine methyltransferase